MKCKIILVVSISLLSLVTAIQVDHYPDDHHYASPSPHHYTPHHYTPHHVKYIEPPHVSPVKYVQSAPVVKHIQPAPVKLVHSAPVKYIQPQHPSYEKHVEYDAPAHYQYSYDVHDEHSGDIKSHTEKRDGDVVHGSYSLIDADGFKRIVEYTADPVHGFNAVVTREPVQNFVKKVYSPYDEPNHLVKHVSIAQPHHHVPHAQNAPIVKTYTAPHSVYAPPEHPKFFKPVLEKKFIKPAYEPIKYVTPAAHYNHY